MDIVEELVLELQTPAKPRLPDGWHMTEKHGLVYVTPDGIAWAVWPRGSLMNSVSVPVRPRELIKYKAGTSKQERLRRTRRQFPVLPNGNINRAVQRTLDELL
jgi:hypothetical protein